MAKKKETREMKLKAQLAETIGDGADGMQTDDEIRMPVDGRITKFVKVVELSDVVIQVLDGGIRWHVGTRGGKICERQILVRE